ncbi:probable E3 ubiquitin-protein ligase makorin-1 [Nyctibius grandis]|uniref:probable E3 ubiquitin-protein ligase makorin-1 n=1 Tax=Nyctibius grandis TaxID=48427 RepID=UPI0035BC8FCC
MEPGSLLASGALRARGGCLRPLCRNFARGSCRWGQNCRFSHERISSHVCRYFLSGFCSNGERCSYEHIREEPVPEGTRYGSGRWSSERDSVPRGAVSREFVPTRARGASGSQPRGLGLDPYSTDPSEATTWTDPAEVPTEPGAAAALVPTEVLRARSEDVVCGICMDRVYEKPLPEERLFGILPNCSHAYCVGCIRKWRRSRDFQSTVIKACPECRVTSSYYIPHKYWVSDVGEKEKLIETFKARMGKIKCKFFIRNRGHCPFKSDCIFLHKLPAGLPVQRRQQRPRMPVEFSPSPSESSDEEDAELSRLEWAISLALRDFWYSRYGREMLLTDFSDSD